MLMLVAVVFIAVFVVVGLLLAAAGTGATEQFKQTLARLDAIAVEAQRQEPDELLDVRRKEMLSSIPWLDGLLRRIEIAPKLRLLLYQADVKWTVGGLLLVSLAAALVAGYAVALRTGAAALGVVLGGGARCLPLVYVLGRRSSRFGKFEEKMPETLDLMVSALRAGHSFTSALGMVAKEAPEPLRKEFKQCFDEQNFGLELRSAMLNLAARVTIQDVKIMVTAILIQKESGGNLAEILEKVAYVIRERFRLRRQVSAHTAQGRLTGWILALLPVILGVLLYLVKPEHISVLWTKPVGVKMLYAATAMTVIGGWIISRIIRIRI